MACKCKDIFKISEKESKIHFITQINELIIKSSNLLEKIGFKTNKISGILTIEEKNPKLFFEENFDFFNINFNDLEKEEIKIFIENEDNQLSLGTIFFAKSFNKYLHFIEDKSFFDIIENSSLTAHFQPIIDIQTNKIFAYEALTRGVLPNGELMYPDVLFSKSTRNDMNFTLDRMCRETALKTTAVKKIDAKVFINFIPTSIYDPEFCLASTVKWAKQLDFDPKNIVFEVVETQNVKDKEHLKNILNFYRKKGFLIALDDVGEGYSSLNMIIDIKPDIIKVDRNIIENIDKDPMKQSIYKALRTICVDNNIKILAEGVETPYELEKVKEIGVDYAQGYYFAKPSSEIIRKIEY
ncbi:MAG: EAL domain-containing protein [Campylobacterales bacterium]|nr:EAL domain-containing protein [Campylobacterales bacterium]